MPTIEVKTQSGALATLRLEIENSDVVLSVEEIHPGEATAVILEAADVEQLMTVVRDLRKALRRERKGKDRTSSIPAP